MIDFPCAVHLERYDDCNIAKDAEHLKELRTLGYITSDEWYAKHLNVKNVDIIDSNDTAEDAPKRRGRPRSE